MTIRVVAAEDSYLIREGVRLLLATQDDLDLVASVGSLPELLAAVDEYLPDVVVTDVRMPPGDCDEGIQAAERLAVTHPTVGMVVLSQYLEPEWAVRRFHPGASGRAYLLKERVGDLAQLRHAIHQHRRGTPWPDEDDHRSRSRSPAPNADSCRVGRADTPVPRTWRCAARSSCCAKTRR